MFRMSQRALAATACALLLGASNAAAFRLIQNTSTGRTSIGAQVTCDDPGGFAHWTTASITWQINPANQGGNPGVAAAVQRALASWTNVTPATYSLSYAGTTSAGFSTDGLNTIVWALDNGCTGSCLAITALVLDSGQVIREADISFNNAVTWNTNGTDYDVEAIAAHELGHSLGIHHTELTKPRNRPTMYATYFGINQRSLETDDWNALNCSFNRYPPAAAAPLVALVAEPGTPSANGPRVTLAARSRPGGAILRFGLAADSDVKLELFDVAGRRLGTLVNANQGTGDHEVAWDGTTTTGHASPGVYFARIETSEGTARATVMLVK